MYGHLPSFNAGMLDDAQFTSTNGPLHARQPSPGRSTSPLNGAHALETPNTYEQLIAQNAVLKTRVSELEVINELFRGRVAQLEQDEKNAKRGEEMHRESEQNLVVRLQQSQGREDDLKRRLDALADEVADLRKELPSAKRVKLSDDVGPERSEAAAMTTPP